MKMIFLTFCIVVISSNVFAAAGPPIPEPNLSITEAIKLANDHFYSGNIEIIDPAHFKREDYIIISVQYTNYFKGKREKEWAWKIKFVHPIQSDHSVALKIMNDKKIIVLYVSE